MSKQGLTVGRVARLAGLSVRTLHHYEAVGLVVPGARSESGYRLYSPRDIQRLQEVLFYRELGMPLEQIKALLEANLGDRVSLLRHQRDLLTTRQERTRRLIEALEAAIEAETRGTIMTDEEMLEVFGDFDPKEYEAEARERWGNSDAFNESTRRAARYTKQEWQQIGAEAAEINEAFVALMKSGVSPASEAAHKVAERHRAHISRWFYECTPEIHAGLAQLYVEDERFTRNIDKVAPGLAHYMAAAMTP